MCGKSAGSEVDLHGLADERTSEWRNHQPGGIGIGLGVSCIFDMHHRACVLEDDVLKASAGTDERDLVLTREADPVERAFKAAIGAPRGTEERIEPNKIMRFIGCEP